MRITAVTVGTRGDVQPMVALGAELSRRGHQVTLGLPPNFEGLARRIGLDMLPIGGDMQVFMESDKGGQLLASGNVKAFMKILQAASHAQAAHRNVEMRRLCDGADVIVSGPLTEHQAASVAERSDVPLVLVHPFPIRATGAVPNPLVTTRNLPAPLNRATHKLFDRIWWKGARADIGIQRAELGLGPTRRSTSARVAARGGTEIQAYSAALVPGLEWGPSRPVVGFLELSAEDYRRLGEAEVSASLEAWLSNGAAPAYFGFGSMPVTNPAQTLDMISRVTASLGLRALVSAGWSGMVDTGGCADRVRVVSTVNHDLVLPRCCLAVHHGGAGTTAASLRAGLPTMVCSVFSDQPFWGRQVERLGAGNHVRFAELSEQTLGNGLEKVTKPAVAERARALGEALRADAGATGRAAHIIESSVGSPRR